MQNSEELARRGITWTSRSDGEVMVSLGDESLIVSQVDLEQMLDAAPASLSGHDVWPYIDTMYERGLNVALRALAREQGES